jgi:uncharacterized protein (TIGR01777 family)
LPTNSSNASPSGHAARSVLVTGATGLIGRALVRSLVQAGDRVIALTRNPGRASALLDGASVRCIDRLDALPDDTALDAVVHLAGARVLDRRWSPARQDELVHSRADVAHEILKLMKRLRQAPRVMASASAVSYYGASGTAPKTEADPAGGADFASQLCVRIEAAACLARELGVRVVPLRLGIVLARDDGALPPLAASARFGLGAELGAGTQPMPWIHLHDAVRLIRLAIDDDALSGPINAVAPQTPTQADFIRAVAASYGRQVHLRVPAAALRLLLGERAVLLLDGQVVVPRTALEAGFVFSYPTLAAALKNLLPL